MNIYVGNIPYSLSEEELKDAFTDFGEVVNVNIVKDKFSGKSKGFGFVEMSDKMDAEEAIKMLDGSPLSGRNIKVNHAKPRGEKSRHSKKAVGQ